MKFMFIIAKNADTQAFGSISFGFKLSVLRLLLPRQINALQQPFMRNRIEELVCHKNTPRIFPLLLITVRI